MEQAEETAAEAIAQRRGSLRLEMERRVVDLQFFQGILDVLIFLTFGRVDPAVDHGLHTFISGQRLVCRVVCQRDGITYSGVRHLFDAGTDIADLAGAKLCALHRSGAIGTDLGHFVFLAGIHQADHIAFFDLPVKDPRVDHDPLVIVVVRVKDQRLKLPVLIALRRRDLMHDLLQKLIDAGALFRGHQRSIHGFHPDDILDLLFDLIRPRRRQVDLIQDRHDLEILIHSQIDIGQRLGLYALGGVHHEDGSLAGGQAPGDLICEVHMARGVDQVEDVFVSVLRLIDETGRLQLDGYTALPLQIHVVKELLPHVPLADETGPLYDPVRQCGFAVVDVRDDAEVSDVVLIVFHTIYCT